MKQEAKHGDQQVINSTYLIYPRADTLDVQEKKMSDLNSSMQFN